MDGISNFLSTMSMSMARSNLQTDASLALMKNFMEADENASARLIESISEAAPSADGRGALMDVRA
ncbi:MAG: YjfB family protein [Ruminiclostridium sp.]|nr:YjfB family protein [Ruminiclostridium sp.]